MIDVVGDLYQYLSTQSPVTELLDSYNDSSAIFAGQFPPDFEISGPAVVIDYPTVNQRLQTASNINRDIQTTLRVYAQVQLDSGYDTLPLQQASETIAGTLTTARISVSGGILRGADVTGPIISPTESASLAGRLITVRWRLEEI